jgi:hypothetical protein
MAKANPFLKRGDGNNALVILGAISRAYRAHGRAPADIKSSIAFC